MSAISRCGQFYWWTKAGYTEKTFPKEADEAEIVW